MIVVNIIAGLLKCIVKIAISIMYAIFMFILAVTKIGMGSY